MHRAVLRVAAGPATGTQEAPVPVRATTSLRVDPADPVRGVFEIEAGIEDITWLDRVLEDLAADRPERGADGRRLGGNQRKAAALFAVFEAVQKGTPPPVLTGSGTRRELGVVLHADTLFDQGPSAADPGEVRGHGQPIPVPASLARTQAQLITGRGAATCVLLADDAGLLLRVLRVGQAPGGRWTRPALVEAARRALDAAPSLSTHRYTPTVSIADHVRARHPTCTAPGCGQPSRCCDLDHDIPWPHGPTTVTNLAPRSRRCHRFKTLRLWRSRLHPGGSIDWTTFTGVRWTHQPEPLPGHAPGEGRHHPSPHEGPPP